MNNCVFVGFVSRDPELSFVPSSGLAVTKFGLAVNEGWGDKKTVNFLNMVAFGKTAEAITSYVAKGSKVTVRTRVKTGSYENKEGRKIYTTDFIVDEIEFPSKKESQGQAQQPQDEDVFEPVEDFSEIPF